jgi:hypothetical protein
LEKLWIVIMKSFFHSSWSLGHQCGFNCNRG